MHMTAVDLRVHLWLAWKSSIFNSGDARMADCWALGMIKAVGVLFKIPVPLAAPRVVIFADGWQLAYMIWQASLDTQKAPAQSFPKLRALSNQNSSYRSKDTANKGEIAHGTSLSPPGPQCTLCLIASYPLPPVSVPGEVWWVLSTVWTGSVFLTRGAWGSGGGISPYTRRFLHSMWNQTLALTRP